MVKFELASPFALSESCLGNHRALVFWIAGYYRVWCQYYQHWWFRR